MTEVQHADPTARRNAFILVVGMIAFAFPIYMAVHEWIAEVRLRSPEDALKALVTALKVITFSAGAGIALLSAYLWVLGVKVRRFQRFPPPNTKVVRDTPVLLGSAAQRRAIALQITAGILFLLGALLVSVALYITHRMAGSSFLP
jgi:hypothetical protein